MEIAMTHEGACATDGCINEGVAFDAPSIDGVVQTIICGGCGVDFRERCTPKS